MLGKVATRTSIRCPIRWRVPPSGAAVNPAHMAGMLSAQQYQPYQ
jgi:hypothetical protein